jgi:nitrite reductase/ring-hydroxylating ferredoxin subunit
MTITDLNIWTDLCALSEIAEGEAKAIFLGERRLCAVNDGQRYFVVEDLCTHGVAFLSDGYCDTDDCVLECPLHGGLFDYRNGSPKGDPAEKPVKTYAVLVDGDRLKVQL